MRNRVYTVSSIIFSFPSPRFHFKMLFSCFVFSHCISYELSNKCRFPRSIVCTYSLLLPLSPSLLWLDLLYARKWIYIGRRDILLWIVHANNLITFFHRHELDVLNNDSFPKVCLTHWTCSFKQCHPNDINILSQQCSLNIEDKRIRGIFCFLSRIQSTRFFGD